jgi:transglutaminase-like putative cysteine protease
MKKSISFLLLITLLFSTSFNTFASASNMVLIEEQGVIAVQLSKPTTVKTLLLVEKDGVRYTYPLVDQQMSQFPLQLGNGEYTVRIMENIESNKYKVLDQSKITLSLKTQNTVFLSAIQDIDWDENSAAVIKARALTKGIKSDSEKVKVIYNYITKNYTYDYAKAKTVSTGYFPVVDEIFESKTGICYDYSSLFAAMLRSVDVPTKLVKGYSTATKTTYHAWNEVFVDGTWKIVDTTVDAGFIQRGKSVQMYKASKDFTAEKIY